MPDTPEYRMDSDPVSHYKYEWKVWVHYCYVPPLRKDSAFKLYVNHPVDWVQVIGPAGWNYLRLHLDDVYALDFERQARRRMRPYGRSR